MSNPVSAVHEAGGQEKAFLYDQHLLDMKTWVGDGPKTFTGLAVFGAVGMILTGLLGMFASLSPLHMLIELYVMVFGVLIIAVEPRCQAASGKIEALITSCPCFKKKNKIPAEGTVDEEQPIAPSPPVETPFKAIIRKEAKFLTVLSGRGYFYIFVGTVLISQGAASVQGVLGMYMVVVGLMHSVIGMHASNKLSKMRNHIKDETEVRKLFKKYDEDRSGTLSAAELKELCKELGSELDDDELMAAMDCLSAGSHSSEIKYGEFFTWWKHVSEV